MTTDEKRDLCDEVCDGLHDEGAPDHHLCSRCYPNGSEALREDVSGEA